MANEPGWMTTPRFKLTNYLCIFMRLVGAQKLEDWWLYDKDASVFSMNKWIGKQDV